MARKKQPTAPARPTRAVLYLRVSTPGQVATDYDPEGLSLPDQREKSIALAKKHGIVIIDEYVEPGRTATSVDKRPVFQAMMHRLRTERDADCIISWALSRMHRNWMENGATLLELNDLGIRLITGEEIDYQTPEGEMMQGMIAVFNGYQSRVTSREVKSKMTRKARLGGTLGRARIGYLNIREEFEGRELRTIKVDEARAPFIKMAFELYATGQYSLRRLRQELTDAGLRTKPTKRDPIPGPISVHALGNLLRDRYYIGYFAWDGIEYQGRHEPLVDQELFDKVQMVLNTQRGGGTRERVHHHYLKGTLFCARCKSRFILMPGKSAHSGTYMYYMCRGRQEHKCDLPYLRVEVAEELMASHYRTLQIPESDQHTARTMITKTREQSDGLGVTVRKRLTRRLSELDNAEENIIDLIGDPDWPKTKLAARLAKIRDERANITRQLETPRKTQGVGPDLLTVALDLLEDPRAFYIGLPEEGKKLMNKATYQRIYLDTHESPQVISEDLVEPFASLIHAYQGRACPEPSTNAGKTVVARHKPGHYCFSTSLEPFFCKEGSSKSISVGWVGLEPTTDGL